MASWIEINFFMINMLPLCLIFSAKLEKREHFFFRLLGGILYTCTILFFSVSDFVLAGQDIFLYIDKLLYLVRIGGLCIDLLYDRKKIAGRRQI